MQRIKLITYTRVTYIQILPKGMNVSEKSYKYIKSKFKEVLGDGDELERVAEALMNYNQKLIIISRMLNEIFRAKKGSATNMYPKQ